MSGTMFLLVSIKWLPPMLWRPGIEAAISKHAFPSSWTEEFGATFAMIKTNTNATQSRTLGEVRIFATARQEFLISFCVSTRRHNFILFSLNCAVFQFEMHWVPRPCFLLFLFPLVDSCHVNPDWKSTWEIHVHFCGNNFPWGRLSFSGIGPKNGPPSASSSNFVFYQPNFSPTVEYILVEACRPSTREQCVRKSTRTRTSKWFNPIG